MSNKQRGGFLMGMIVGLLIGLALALGVALYVTKVPVPFVNKVPQRTPDQDAAEAQKNKNWDPNAPLSNRTARPNAASGQVSSEPSASAAAQGAAATAPTAAAASAPAPESTRDPAAILAGQSPAAAPAKMPPETAAAKATGDGFSYFVQAGAYARTEDAEQQRARLSLLGFDAKVTEREQAGRTVYRVRVGPYGQKDQAEATKTSLDGAGIESALVRVQK